MELQLDAFFGSMCNLINLTRILILENVIRWEIHLYLKLGLKVLFLLFPQIQTCSKYSSSSAELAPGDSDILFILVTLSNKYISSELWYDMYIISRASKRCTLAIDGRAKFVRDYSRFGFVNAKMHNLPLFYLFLGNFSKSICWFLAHFVFAKLSNRNIGRPKNLLLESLVISIS